MKTVTEIRCTKCGADGPFPPSAYTGSCSRRWCNPCYNEWRRLNYEKPHVKATESRRHANWVRTSQYGINLEKYDAVLVTQNGVCANCKVPNNAKTRLHIDHDHATGKIRGLLCNNCNRGIGFFVDDPKLLRGAADYLETANELLRLTSFE